MQRTHGVVGKTRGTAEASTGAMMLVFRAARVVYALVFSLGEGGDLYFLSAEPVHSLRPAAAIRHAAANERQLRRCWRSARGSRNRVDAPKHPFTLFNSRRIPGGHASMPRCLNGFVLAGFVCLLRSEALA